MEPLKLLAEIVRDEMELQPNQVVLEDQHLEVPTAGVFITVAYVSGKPIGNNNYFKSLGPAPEDGAEEIGQIAMNYLVQLDVMSFDDAARQSLPGILIALTSVRAQRRMAEEAMQIGRIPPAGFLNVSALETAAMLNRYTMTVALKALQQKVKAVDYYSEFPGPEVHTNV